MKLLHKVYNLLFPAKCVLCQKVLSRDETDLCRSCRTETPDFPSKSIKLPYLATWTALWYYEGKVRHSLLRFKFGNRRSYAQSYGRLLAMKLLQEQVAFDLLTWVPTGRLRIWRRGYDQVALLAAAVGKELGIPVLSALKKIRNNQPQSRITGASQRRANVLGAYTVQKPEDVRGKRVLLLDDILTTGATAGECAKILLTAGAKEVICAAVAAASHTKQ